MNSEYHFIKKSIFRIFAQLPGELKTNLTVNQIAIKSTVQKLFSKLVSKYNRKATVQSLDKIYL